MSREPQPHLYEDSGSAAPLQCTWDQEQLQVLDTASAQVSGLSEGAPLHWAWTVNGEPLSTDSATLQVGDWASRGDTIGLTVSDGAVTVDCEDRTVENTPPQGGVLTIGTPTVRPGDDLLCQVRTLPHDPDGDNISSSIRWTVDGAPYDGLRTDLPGDTVPAEDIEPGQVWTCALESDDGLESSESPYRRRVLMLDESPIELQYVPPGSFEMGRPDEASCGVGEQPLHTVTLSRGFWIGATEVTQQQFEIVMGFNPAYFEDCPDCPVERESWYEALAFAGKLSERFGYANCTDCRERTPSELEAVHSDPMIDEQFANPTGCRYTCADLDDPLGCEGFRLPTSAEWEYAARGGPDYAAVGDYTDSGSLDTDECEQCPETPELDSQGTPLSELMWYGCSAKDQPHPVALLTPNPLGMYDVLGNVFEWNVDNWSETPATGDVTDPVVTEGAFKGLRGGGYDSPAYQASLGQLWMDPPDSCYVYRLGFRVAMTD